MALHLRFAPGILLGLIVSLSGCATGPDRSTPARGVGAVTSGALKPADTVPVALIDFGIEMPASVPAGKKVFEVTNKGTLDHGFGIRGKGMDQQLDSNLLPGATRTMEADLRPGNYLIYCPVDGHKDRGMSKTLVVR